MPNRQRECDLFLRIDDLVFHYGEGDFRLAVPQLEVARGASVAVIGPSGSGKTTLLHLVAGVLVPDSGRVRVDDVEVSALGDAARRDFRITHIGAVFQEFELLTYLGVLDNILLPYRITGALTLDASVRARAAALAERVGIADKLHRNVRRLSQGEKQRVAICRALLPQPPMLLADEPTGNLDPSNKDRVLDILQAYAEEHSATLLTVTHDHALLSPLLARHRRGGPRRTGREGMSGSLYLAWRYLAHHRIKTAVLVGSSPSSSSSRWRSRSWSARASVRSRRGAEATPLLVGAKGSPTELVGSTRSTSRRRAGAAPVRPGGACDRDRLRARGAALRALPVPRGPDRRDLAGLLPVPPAPDRRRPSDDAAGRLRGRCPRGGAPGPRARRTVISSPESVFDLAGVYPLKMRVTGVLAPTDSPDDDAIFVDVKTAWVIEGRAHGHEDLSKPEAHAGVLERKGNRITANASVRQYNEITDANVASFHFHGDPATFPVTAILAVPHDEKARALLMGRYLGAEERYQILQPVAVVDELLDTVFTIQRFVVAATVLVGLSTLATAVLVFVLSLRLRKREIETMIKIGGARAGISAVLILEILVVLAASALIAVVLTLITRAFAAEVMRAFLQ